MENIELYRFVINSLIISAPFSWYMCYQMYKDLKKKDRIIEMQGRIISKYNIKK